MASDSAGQDDAFGALSQFFISDGTLGDTLLRVAQLACKAVGSADMAGLTLLVDGKPATGVFTDPEAPEIDATQYESGHGPCLDAFRHQQVYRIDSTAEDQRWPEFSRDAAAHGITATLSVPVTARRESLGALNFYSRTGPFDNGHSHEAELFAEQAAIVLANAQVYWDARQLGENMQQAMRSRAVIDQAIGILLADGGRTPDEAFQLLVRVSQRENRKLREIAADIVDRAVQRTRQ
ncbi:MAG TPA: GAF and ANTAR domain-containing protein [Streptosporangiaceae bacterium]|jgi:GAF domain-containing protein